MAGHRHSHKVAAMGLALMPSMASLARVFRQTGVARSEPRKKPRSAWRRFVYPAPNDDQSRYAVASRAAAGETAQDAVAVFDWAVATHGVPGLLPTDNGLALNPSRHGLVGRLVAHVAQPGTEAIIAGRVGDDPPRPVHPAPGPLRPRPTHPQTYPPAHACERCPDAELSPMS